MNKRDIFKTAVSFVSSMAVGTLASMMIKNNVNPVKLTEKLAVGIGGFVLSDYISSKATDHVEAEIDKIFDAIDTVKNSKNAVVISSEQEYDKDRSVEEICDMFGGVFKSPDGELYAPHGSGPWQGEDDK